MSTKEVVELVCDLCGLSDKDGAFVATHRVTIDDRATEAEACERCWEGAVTDLRKLAIKGRTPTPRMKPKIVSRQLVEWPGTAWQVSSHALLRMGERKLNPLDVFRVADKPAHTYPGREEGLMVHVGKDGLKVVVCLKKKAIITAAMRDEVVEDVA